MGMSIEILADRTDDEPLLLVAELRIERQRERFTGGRFRVGKIARLVAQRLEAKLQVERDRVIDLRADLSRRQIFTQRVAKQSGHADDILIVDVEVALSLAW